MQRCVRLRVGRAVRLGKRGGEEGEEGAHEGAKTRRGEERQKEKRGEGGNFIWFLLFVPKWLRVQSL